MTTHTNVVGWFDLYVNDMARAVRFYEAMLNVQLVPIEDPTGDHEIMRFPAEMNAYGTTGALVKTHHGQPGVGGTTLFFTVDDCARQEAAAVAAGGTVIRSKFQIGDFGYVCLMTDPEGNRIGFRSLV